MSQWKQTLTQPALGGGPGRGDAMGGQGQVRNPGKVSVEVKRHPPQTGDRRRASLPCWVVFPQTKAVFVTRSNQPSSLVRQQQHLGLAAHPACFPHTIGSTCCQEKWKNQQLCSKTRNPELDDSFPSKRFDFLTVTKTNSTENTSSRCFRTTNSLLPLGP